VRERELQGIGEQLVSLAPQLLDPLWASPLLADRVPLMAQLLEVGQKLEQEAIDTPALRDAIRAVCTDSPAASGLDAGMSGQDGYRRS
jgi:hypothetical protein